MMVFYGFLPVKPMPGTDETLNKISFIRQPGQVFSVARKIFYLYRHSKYKTYQQMKNPCILITGGSGFLGGQIVKELLEDDSPVGPAQVRTFDNRDFTGSETVDAVKGDICDYAALSSACKDIDAVIHCAAVVDWGTHPPGYVYKVNYGGTENVIRACREHGIRHLVFTSSLDAVYTGKPLRDIDDSQPYPARYHNMYCKSKVMAEQIVKAVAGKKLRAVILRPSDIYGPGDPYHMNALIGMARSGFYVRLGNGKSKAQHIYVGNMAMAHLQALKALMEGNEKINGQAYLMTDGPAANFFKFFDQIVAGAGYRIWPKNLWIPHSIAWPMGCISESIAFLLRPLKRFNPGLSRFAVDYTCTDFTFTSKRASMDFGFKPKYSEEDAISLTADYYRKG